MDAEASAVSPAPPSPHPGLSPAPYAPPPIFLTWPHAPVESIASSTGALKPPWASTTLLMAGASSSSLVRSSSTARKRASLADAGSGGPFPAPVAAPGQPQLLTEGLQDVHVGTQRGDGVAVASEQQAQRVLLGCMEGRIARREVDLLGLLPQHVCGGEGRGRGLRGQSGGRPDQRMLSCDGHLTRPGQGVASRNRRGQAPRDRRACATGQRSSLTSVEGHHEAGVVEGPEQRGPPGKGGAHAVRRDHLHRDDVRCRHPVRVVRRGAPQQHLLPCPPPEQRPHPVHQPPLGRHRVLLVRPPARTGPPRRHLATHRACPRRAQSKRRRIPPPLPPSRGSLG